MSDFFPDDKRFAKLMRKSRLEIPSVDFDDNVMREIEAGVKAKASVRKDLSLSLMFLVIATGLGAVVGTCLPNLPSSISYVSPDNLLSFFQAIFVFIVLALFEKLIRLVKKNWIV